MSLHCVPLAARPLGLMQAPPTEAPGADGVHAALWQRLAQAYLKRRPQAYRVVLDVAAPAPAMASGQAPSPVRGAAGEASADLLALAAPGGWQRLGLPAGAKAPPVLLTLRSSLGGLTREQFAQLMLEVGRRAPAGSRLLMEVPSWLALWRDERHRAAADRGRGFGLRRLDELTAAHPRLRLDGRQTLPAAGTRRPTGVDLVLHLLAGVPYRAVYEIGVDA